nr:hypothetical protein [Anaerolineae bacterium]
GHSKEKRTDCPLVTLGLVLDGNGFPSTGRTSTPTTRPRRRCLTTCVNPTPGVGTSGGRPRRPVRCGSR